MEQDNKTLPAHVKESIEALRKLLNSGTALSHTRPLTPYHWQDGTAGDANIVTYDGEDVVGVMRVDDPIWRRFIIEQHNKFIDALLMKVPPEPTGACGHGCHISDTGY